MRYDDPGAGLGKPTSFTFTSLAQRYVQRNRSAMSWMVISSSIMTCPNSSFKAFNHGAQRSQHHHV